MFMTKKISNKQYAQALLGVTKDLKGEKISEAIKRFVLLLARQHKLKRAEQIIAEYEKCEKKENGEVDIAIKTARKLDKTLLEKIKKEEMVADLEQETVNLIIAALEKILSEKVDSKKDKELIEETIKSLRG